MTARRELLATAVLTCILTGVIGHVGLAANPTNVDPREDTATGFQTTPSLSPGMGAPATEPQLSGNPLWAIPLSSLSATRERPIFLPSRRAPAPTPAVAAAPYVPPPAKPAAIPEPERPALNLVGIVSGTDDGLAVFINSTTRDIVRLRTGEGHEGWILRSVKGREVMFEKNHRNVVIEMPPAGGDQK